jgi:hypothetical protein
MRDPHTVDIMMPSRNRLEFCRKTLEILERNTDWNLVNKLWLYDDQSVDGTREFLYERAQTMPADTEVVSDIFNSPYCALLDCVSKSKTDFICKVDNDCLLPFGWLNAGVGVMDRDPSLDLLGIAYRDDVTPHCGEQLYTYKVSSFIGGIGVYRRDLLKDLPVEILPVQNWRGIWQQEMKVGYLSPSLPVCLLDWMPWDPWVTLSERYEAIGWQRRWGRYGKDNVRLWQWWWPDAPKAEESEPCQQPA